MDILSILLLGVGLAMDCFAVSVAQGLAVRRPDRRILLMAFLFGFFQGGMPLVGYFAGTLFADFFSLYAPYVALALLALIGGRMIVESLRPDDSRTTEAEWGIGHLLVLAVATSIDALSTGVIFIPYPESLWLGVGVIAAVSFLFSLAGYYTGVYAGSRFRFNATLLGGIILVLIGVKIFLEGVL